MKTPLFLLRIGRIAIPHKDHEHRREIEVDAIHSMQCNVTQRISVGSLVFISIFFVVFVVELLLFRISKVYFRRLLLVFLSLSFFLVVVCNVVDGYWFVVALFCNRIHTTITIRNEFIYCNCSNGNRQRLSLHCTEYAMKMAIVYIQSTNNFHCLFSIECYFFFVYAMLCTVCSSICFFFHSILPSKLSDALKSWNFDCN